MPSSNPSASPIGLDAHPFSTDNFFHDQIYWTQVPRSTLQPADALVRRADFRDAALRAEATDVERRDQA